MTSVILDSSSNNGNANHSNSDRRSGGGFLGRLKSLASGSSSSSSSGNSNNTTPSLLENETSPSTHLPASPFARRPASSVTPAQVPGHAKGNEAEYYGHAPTNNGHSHALMSRPHPIPTQAYSQRQRPSVTFPNQAGGVNSSGQQGLYYGAGAAAGTVVSPGPILGPAQPLTSTSLMTVGGTGGGGGGGARGGGSANRNNHNYNHNGLDSIDSSYLGRSRTTVAPASRDGPPHQYQHRPASHQPYTHHSLHSQQQQQQQQQQQGMRPYSLVPFSSSPNLQQPPPSAAATALTPMSTVDGPSTLTPTRDHFQHEYQSHFTPTTTSSGSVLNGTPPAVITPSTTRISFMTTQTPSLTASSKSTGTGPVLRQTQFLSHEQSRTDTMPGLGDEADQRAMGDNSGGSAGGLARAKSVAQQSALLKQQQYQKQRLAQFVEEEGSRGESSGRLGSRQKNSMGSPTSTHTSGISSSPGATAADFGSSRGTTLESAPLLLPQNSRTSRSGFGSSSAENHRSLRSTISMEHLRQPNSSSSSPMSSSPSNAPLANPPIQIPPPLKPRPVFDESTHGGITFMRVADPPQPTMAPGSDRGRIWEQGALRALMDNVDETDSRPSEIIPGPDDPKEEDSLEGSRRPINSWKPWNPKEDGATAAPAMTSSSSSSSSRDASPRGHRRGSGITGSFIATPTMATFPEEQEPLSGFASASTSPPLTGPLSEPLASPSLLTPTAERMGHGTLSNGSGTTAQAASHGASSTKARSGTLASVGSMATLVAGGAGNSNSTLIMHDAPRDRRSEHVHIEEGSGPVVLMAIGKTGQGKSSLLNKIMGTSELKASASVRAVTKGIAERTGWGKFEMSRRVLVTLADTPGLADTEGDDEKNIPILKDYISSIGTRLGVTAFLLVFKIDAGVEMIMTILTTFNEIMQEHPNFWENVILVFTGCDFKRNVMSTKELYHRVIQEELSKLFLNRIYLNDQGQGEESGETHPSRDGSLHSRTTSTTMGLDTELSEEPSSLAGHDDDVPSSSSLVPQIPMVFLSTAEAPCGFALGEKCDCKARSSHLNAGLKRLWYAIKNKKRWVVNRDDEDDDEFAGHS